jgi:hypothetical protein
MASAPSCRRSKKSPKRQRGDHSSVSQRKTSSRLVGVSGLSGENLLNLFFHVARRGGAATNEVVNVTVSNFSAG